MPCYDSRNYDFSEERENLNEKINRLEAVLCAITHDLKRRGLLEKVKETTKISSKIDIEPIIQEHLAKDVSRLRADLNRYSSDELDLIKHILNSLGD